MECGRGWLRGRKRVPWRCASDGATKVSIYHCCSHTKADINCSHTAAIVNGTMYIFGGRSSTRADQDSDTWSMLQSLLFYQITKAPVHQLILWPILDNNFLQLDLTESWSISSPSLTGLSVPSDLPSVANGYLWNSYASLFLYGGQFSDTPVTSPVPFVLWEYDLDAETWEEHPEPTTSAGENADGDGGEPVQRSSEGAGVNVASLGRGWYFGGHLDGYTTVGWSQSTPRVYLKSLLEFTFPGQTNEAVPELGGGELAGEEGTWRNITQGGLQDEAGFTERADGLLVYVPGFGELGILLGLAGGTNATFVSSEAIRYPCDRECHWYTEKCIVVDVS